MALVTSRPTRRRVDNSTESPLVRSSCEPTANTAVGSERRATASTLTVGRVVFCPKNGSTLRCATTCTALRGLLASMVVTKRLAVVRLALQLPQRICRFPSNVFWVSALCRAALLSLLSEVHSSSRCAPASAARSATFCASRLAQNR